MLQQAVNKLKLSVSGLNVEYSCLGKIQKRPQAQVQIQIRNGYLSGYVSNDTNDDTLKQVIDQLASIKLESDIKKAFQTGIQLEIDEQISNVYDEAVTKLNPKEHAGKIVLIIMWASWSSPCNRPMNYIKKILERNEQKWKDKVEVIALSVDKSKQKIQQKIQKMGWEKNMTHVTLGGWRKQNCLISKFNIEQLPFIVLFDTDGKTNYVGQPVQVDFQERINLLLGQNIDKQSTEPDKHPLTALVKSFNKQKLDKIFEKKDMFVFTYEITNSYHEDKYSTKLKVKAFIEQGSQVLEEKVQKQIFSLPQPDPNFQISWEKIKFENIPLLGESTKCTLCQEKLEYPCYCLFWQESKFACCKCIEQKTEDHKYTDKNDKNNCILLMDASVTKVESIKLGKNYQPQDPSIFKDKHNFNCAKCKKSPQSVCEPRYICLKCRPEPNFSEQYIDYCETCIKERTKEIKEKRAESDPKEEHQPNHPFVRVLYNTKGYYFY